MKIAVLALAVVALAGAAAATEPLPTFPLDFSTDQSDIMVVHQGQYSVEGSSYCCTAGDSCEVQYQSQIGSNYVWYTHNKTRFDSTGGQAQTIVNDFNIGKEMLVVNGTCSEYCPIEGGLFPFNLEGLNATYNGTTTVNGKTVQHWTWDQVAFGVIVMQTTDFYCEIGSDGKATPVQQVDHLTPFGQPIGQQTQTWTNWVSGSPNAKLFDVAGVADCPESQKCGNNQNAARAMNRLRNRMYKTWLRYQFEDEQQLE